MALNTSKEFLLGSLPGLVNEKANNLLIFFNVESIIESKLGFVLVVVVVMLLFQTCICSTVLFFKSMLQVFKYFYVTVNRESRYGDIQFSAIYSNSCTRC